MKKQLFGLVAAASIAFAGSASAATITTFTFDQSAAFGSAVAGTVTVTDTGSELDFVVSLVDGFLFKASGNQHDSLAFNLDLGGLLISPVHPTNNLGNDFLFQATGSSFSEGTFSAADFNYAIDCITETHGPTAHAGCVNGPDGTKNPQSYSFSIAGVGLSNLFSNQQFGGKDIWFSADVTTNPGHGLFAQSTAAAVTGNIGATLDSGGGVPEPATWAMMLVGFGGMGAILRRRRAVALA